MNCIIYFLKEIGWTLPATEYRIIKISNPECKDIYRIKKKTIFGWFYMYFQSWSDDMEPEPVLTTGFYTLKEAEKHIPIVRKYTYNIVKEIKKE